MFHRFAGKLGATAASLLSFARLTKIRYERSSGQSPHQVNTSLFKLCNLYHLAGMDFTIK